MTKKIFSETELATQAARDLGLFVDNSYQVHGDGSIHVFVHEQDLADTGAFGFIFTWDPKNPNVVRVHGGRDLDIVFDVFDYKGIRKALKENLIKMGFVQKWVKAR